MHTDLTESPILALRPNVLARHRRIAGALWFGACAFLAGALATRLRFGAGSEIGLVAFGTLSALLPGIVFGAQILDQHITKSTWSAVWRGAVIVLIAHTIFSIALFGQPALTGSTGWWSIPVVFLFSLIFAGWMTLPVGCIGAIALYKLGGWKVRPRGCAIHKYRN